MVDAERLKATLRAMGPTAKPEARRRAERQLEGLVLELLDAKVRHGLGCRSHLQALTDVASVAMGPSAGRTAAAQGGAEPLLLPVGPRGDAQQGVGAGPGAAGRGPGRGGRPDPGPALQNPLPREAAGKPCVGRHRGLACIPPAGSSTPRQRSRPSMCWSRTPPRSAGALPPGSGCVRGVPRSSL